MPTQLHSPVPMGSSPDPHMAAGLPLPLTPPPTAPLKPGLGPIPAPSALQLAWIAHLPESKNLPKSQGSESFCAKRLSAIGGRAAFSARLPFISYQHSQGCFLGHLPSTPPPNAHHAALCPLSKANCPGRAVYPPHPRHAAPRHGHRATPHIWHHNLIPTPSSMKIDEPILAHRSPSLCLS